MTVKEMKAGAGSPHIGLLLLSRNSNYGKSVILRKPYNWAFWKITVNHSVIGATIKHTKFMVCKTASLKREDAKLSIMKFETRRVEDEHI
jgi:hypothetical protein